MLLFRDELASALAAIEAERRARSGSIQKTPRSLQAEMECEESGNSLGEQEDGSLRTEVARATKRLRELCAHLRRGEDDSGLQSDCDESMLVINLNNSEAEVGTNDRDTHSSPVSNSFHHFLNYKYIQDDKKWPQSFMSNHPGNNLTLFVITLLSD